MNVDAAKLAGLQAARVNGFEELEKSFELFHIQ